MNMQILVNLRKMQTERKVHHDAEALLIFDRNEPTDLISLNTLTTLGWMRWIENVTVDERGLCKSNRVSRRFCWRAVGTFHLGSVRVRSVNIAVGEKQTDPQAQVLWGRMHSKKI